MTTPEELEDEFDRLIASRTDVLHKMALEAIAEDEAGLTEELDADMFFQRGREE